MAESSRNGISETEHSAAVRDMFSGIAGKYDLLNHTLSLNIDKRWRRRVAKLLSGKLADPNSIVLDIACGTGDLAIELSEAGSAKVIATDFCRPMLEIADQKASKRGLDIPLVEADGLALSFPDDSFDAVTIAFGLRNFSNWEAGIKEFFRILKPGGVVVILEFSAPIVPGFKQLFSFYFSNILPRIGGAVSGSRGAYEYLPDSVSKFPDQKRLVEIMRQNGFSNVEYSNLTGGIAALHSGTK
ncbi:MAG: bifunctional demethylmenaquinone methyltransferase/2-methoxy-6-polyprenyl-1,4-benzoquinol methylase UbiE [Pyrinomonadaceae bacterium]